MNDFAAVEIEMAKVRDQAREQDDPVVEALALTALGEAVLRREGDPVRAQALVDEALRLLDTSDAEPTAQFDARVAAATIDAWRGDVESAIRHMERAYAIGIDARRKDLQTIAAQALAQTHIVRLELEEAEMLLTRALELAGESGSVIARMGTTLSYGWFLTVKGEFDAAETVLEEVRATAAEIGRETAVAAAVFHLGILARRRGDTKRAEKLIGEAVRITAARGDRGFLPERQAFAALSLVDSGKIDEAERIALEAQSAVGREDPGATVYTGLALGAVRAAQGRDDEAEALFRRTLALAEEGGFKEVELEPLRLLVKFLRERGREDEAARYEERLAELNELATGPAIGPASRDEAVA
jgi:tetratricopeptide (TPR) repeat protein